MDRDYFGILRWSGTISLILERGSLVLWFLFPRSGLFSVSTTLNEFACNFNVGLRYYNTLQYLFERFLVEKIMTV